MNLKSQIFLIKRRNKRHNRKININGLLNYINGQLNKKKLGLLNNPCI
jgi:hypothetical protein